MPLNSENAHKQKAIKYALPYEKISSNSKLVLYGAGDVCADYLEQIHYDEKYDVTCIVDRRFAELNDIEGIKVRPPKWLVNNRDAYDYVIIASFVYVDEIFSQLKSMGIQSEKIVHAFPLGRKPYSTNGEDLIVSTIFKMLGKPIFSYMDIGANEPYKDSNTAYLYLNDCRGICIEPNPDLISFLKTERVNDIVLNVGVGTKSGLFSYYRFTENVFNTFSDVYADECIRFGRELKDKIDIQVLTLQQIVDNYFEGKYPDFLQIDIEGMDFDVLQSAKFTDDAPTVVCVETCNCGEERMDAMMKGKGYLTFSRTVTNTIYLKNTTAKARIV